MNLYTSTLHEQAKTDPNAAWELSEDEITTQLKAAGVANKPFHRRDYADAYRDIGRAFRPIPKLTQVPIPVELAVEIVEYQGNRAWTDAPTDEDAHLSLAPTVADRVGGAWF